MRSVTNIAVPIEGMKLSNRASGVAANGAVRPNATNRIATTPRASQRSRDVGGKVVGQIFGSSDISRSANLISLISHVSDPRFP